VIKYLLDHDISVHVIQMGNLAIEFRDEKAAGLVTDECLAHRLFVRQTQGNMIRIFPALNISAGEMEEGLAIIEAAIETAMEKLSTHTNF
jgi:acetylornithine/N-succinyldiaminopimelate aminotransferase